VCVRARVCVCVWVCGLEHFPQSAEKCYSPEIVQSSRLMEHKSRVDELLTRKCIRQQEKCGAINEQITRCIYIYIYSVLPDFKLLTLYRFIHLKLILLFLLIQLWTVRGFFGLLPVCTESQSYVTTDGQSAS
jgi:hypothetical protein